MYLFLKYGIIKAENISGCDSMRKNNILIVEDETNILRIISNYFKKANYEVYEATNGEEALNIFFNTNLDIIVLDIMIPKIDGFEVARRIRSTSNIPIIAMTALSEEQDMITGYNLKLDDYVVKPLKPKILVMKVNNLLARLKEPESMKQNYKIGNIELDFGGFKAYLDGIDLNLSKTEFKLLAYLIKNKNRACSRTLLLDEIWGMEVYVDSRIVDTYIKSLRKALKPYEYIKTIFGLGYMFSEDQNVKK